jgi:predicted Holliday junction resolvase-like endonuclease
MNNLLLFIDNLQNILGLCPCCGEIFLLTNAKLIFTEKKENKSKYGLYLSSQKELELQQLKIEKMETNLEKLEEKHANVLDEIKEMSRNTGRRNAKKALKRLGSVFSGRNIDPQDVKVIFDPVEYIVFDGMCDKSIKKIELVGRRPKTKQEENIEKSINKAIQQGDYNFKVLRIDKEGNIELE